MVGPRVNLRRVAPSRLLETLYAYIALKSPRTEGDLIFMLGFLSFSCRLGFSFSFVLYFHFVFRSCSRAERFRETQRDIDVIDGDNLCKGVSFLLYCNLLHLLHDAWLISSSHDNLTTNH